LPDGENRDRGNEEEGKNPVDALDDGFRRAGGDSGEEERGDNKGE